MWQLPRCSLPPHPPTPSPAKFNRYIIFVLLELYFTYILTTEEYPFVLYYFLFYFGFGCTHLQLAENPFFCPHCERRGIWKLSKPVLLIFWKKRRDFGGGENGFTPWQGFWELISPHRLWLVYVQHNHGERIDIWCNEQSSHELIDYFFPSKICLPPLPPQFLHLICINYSSCANNSLLQLLYWSIIRGTTVKFVLSFLSTIFLVFKILQTKEQ